MSTVTRLAASALLGAGLLLSTAHAQQTEIAPRSADGKAATQSHFSKEQLLTSTVHQAWLLSEKNEANFFEMVEQLAQISASNRGIALPDSEAAGRRMGETIKRLAKADTDQLLYAVVDKAVRMTSTKPVHAAGQPTQ